MRAIWIKNLYLPAIKDLKPGQLSTKGVMASVPALNEMNYDPIENEDDYDGDYIEVEPEAEVEETETETEQEDEDGNDDDEENEEEEEEWEYDEDTISSEVKAAKTSKHMGPRGNKK